MMPSNKKRILVTGASKGIGRGIAILLANNGYEVVCHYNSDKIGAEKTIDSIDRKNNSTLLQFDIKNSVECEKILGMEVEEKGAFWGVILNAGIKKDRSFLSMEQEDWSSVIDTNLSGFYNVLKPIIRPMLQLKNGGRIICISSLSSSLGVGGQVNYSASKGGLEAAARSLAMELAKRQVTVNSICPGYIETDMLNDLDKSQIIEQIPMKRIGITDDIAHMVNFLLSDSAGYITKQSIRIDGGIS